MCDSGDTLLNILARKGWSLRRLPRHVRLGVVHQPSELLSFEQRVKTLHPIQNPHHSQTPKCVRRNSNQAKYQSPKQIDFKAQAKQSKFKANSNQIQTKAQRKALPNRHAEATSHITRRNPTFCSVQHTRTYQGSRRY